MDEGIDSETGEGIDWQEKVKSLKAALADAQKAGRERGNENNILFHVLHLGHFSPLHHCLHVQPHPSRPFLCSQQAFSASGKYPLCICCFFDLFSFI